ncbi:MAG: hypothetical protein ACI8V5_002340 [Limisphaerales bacterium]
MTAIEDGKKTTRKPRQYQVIRANRPDTKLLDSSEHVMRSLLTLTGIAAIAALSCGCSKPIPVEQKLADCTNSALQFQMMVEQYPPYQFLLGIPQTSTGQLSFRGEVIVSQSTGTVARVPIGSHDITPCNWLDHQAGYILTWRRTNNLERLETFLVRGQTYDVLVKFSEAPPVESSFWLSSMGRVGL